MKIPIVLGFSLLITLPVENLIAQERQPESGALGVKVVEEVTRAANAAKVKADEPLLRAFADAASGQATDFAYVYNTVPTDVRVARLAGYLTAKAAARTHPPSGGVTSDDLKDFHWGYIAKNNKYSPIRLQSPKPARLVSVESMKDLYVFALKEPWIQPNAVFLLPTAVDPMDPNVTVTFVIDNAKAAWTGIPAHGRLTVMVAGTSKGCEIYVNSVPIGAAVYFNKKEWHARTNTSSVRDPGTWEVILRLDGHREWRVERSLGAGQSWTIDARLVKQ